MVYEVLLHPRAAKELVALEEPARARVKERLRELRNDPDKKGKRLKYSDFWSIRIGEIRAIYQISNDPRRVIVLFIGNRKNVYDDFSKLF